MQLEWTSIFFLGIAYGTTVCSLSCLPILAPCVLSTGRGFRDGLSLSFSFMQGKVLAYSFMGGLAALFGSSFLNASSAQQILGLVLIIMGIMLPFMNRRKCSSTCEQPNRKLPFFTLGLSTSLVPCPPLIAILTTAAARGDVVSGSLYGALFGIGLTISPLLLAGGGAAAIAKTINMKSPRIQLFTQALSALLIINMGINMILARY